VEIKDLIRQITAREPLNPYQIAGMTAVIRRSGIAADEFSLLEVEDLKSVLMLLDRTGEEAAEHLIAMRTDGSRVILLPKFPSDALDKLALLSAFEGRRQSIRENLIPVFCDIPNWLDLVRLVSRYSLERDDDSMASDIATVMEIMLSYLFAATLQPFDAEARSEGEYAIARLAESILKSTSDDSMPGYLPHLERCLDFLGGRLFSLPLNSFERRVIEIISIRSALNKRSGLVQTRLGRRLDKMAAQALVTGLGEVRPCPAAPIDKLRQAVAEYDFSQRERFRREIVQRIDLHSADEIEKRRAYFQRFLEDEKAALSEPEFRQGMDYIRTLGDEWRDVLASFQDMVEDLPAAIQSGFAELLAVEILAIEKPEIKDILIEGLCSIVMRLEKTKKRASKNLVDEFAELFLRHACSSSESSQAVASLRALERLGTSLGRNNYFLITWELISHIVRYPLIRPRERKFTIEDDDSGEPLVIAEDAAANRAHVQHIKTLLALVASNPRIMLRLMPYLVVQLELGGARLCDEDLIQYWISSLLRANSSVTHFLTRTLIKAIPYSFKDIGPLDTLRLTAAGLGKELANRGVKPIGNFLGKLRGDIHWRGSVENYFFCQGILSYFAAGDPNALSEWMPRESMPYLTMNQWCSPEEADGLKALMKRIFQDHGVDPSNKEGLKSLISVETAKYREDPNYPAFSRRMALDVLELLQGLYEKYFIVTGQTSDGGAAEDIDRLQGIIAQRREIKEKFLTPDINDPMPAVITLTEGMDDHVREIDRIRRDQPGTPILLRARKAGHAYAQRATYISEAFEAFNKDLGLEALQETLATSISNTHFDRITLENLPNALGFLDLLVAGLSVNGHSSYYLEQGGKDLRHAGALGLTFDKVRDLLKTIKKELDDVHDFYRNWFEEHFDQWLAACPLEQIPRKLRDLTTLKDVPETDFFKNYLKTLYISDLQARDGNLRALESFIDKVELFLNQRLAESGRLVVSGDAAEADDLVFYFPDQGDISACKIGLKGLLLRFAENTPPYFVITTAAALKAVEELESDAAFRDGLSTAVKALESASGRRFGDPAAPALLSVRSGARISMPGMMATITNVGVNDEIAARLAADVNLWFAYDSYRRFLQEFGQSVYGIEREEFQEIIDGHKTRWKATFKAQMSGDQMRRLAFDYKHRLGQLAPEAIELLDEGRFLDILIRCAAVVLHSYEGRPALKYREAACIDGNWRTPVVVQAMVYGNLDFESSGTGVVSYNPFTMDLRGDFAHGDQGTDVVDGKVATIPVNDFWKQADCLALRMPESWKQLQPMLVRAAERLHLHVNVEYTIEKGRVFFLQIRKNREKIEIIPSLESSGYRVLAQGAGVFGKIFRGIMVTNRDQIAPFRHINKAQSIIDAMNRKLPEGEKLDGFIFVVNDPIPEEIMEQVFSLPVSTALVSRRGGRGAHAADIAKSLGRVYIGQVRQIAKFSGRAESVRFTEEDVVVGSKLVIHGQTGEIALYK
jgi:pyruvate,orthophosphate dikinase